MYTYFLIPIFYLLYQLLWGYYCQFFILVALYPDISFFAFFGVCFCLSHTLCFMFSLLFSGCVPRHFIFYISLGTRLLVHHLLWLQHTPIHQHFIFAISRGTTLHHTIHTLPPTTHKSILWRRFAPEYAFFSFSCVSNSVPMTGSISSSTTYSIIFLLRFQ